MLCLNIFKSKLRISNMRILLHNSLRQLKEVAFEDVPLSEVSTSAIKKTLKQNGFIYEEAFTCFIIRCTFCGHEKKSKVYINKTTGYFMCSSCKKMGQWDMLQSFLTTTKGTKKWKLPQNLQQNTEFEYLKETILNINNTSTELNSLMEDDLKELLEKFKFPDLPPKAFNHLNVRIDETNTSLLFPLEDSESTLAGYRRVHCDSSVEDTVLPGVTYGGLLTIRMPKSKETAVLVPNISDFLILLKAKINVSIVCLPNHIKNLPQYFLPSLERFKKLILWFGWDGPAWDATRHFAKKLGDKRCYIIRTCDTQNLPHIDKSQDFKAILSKAQPVYHKSITTFSNLRADVLSELRNTETVQGVKWKRFPSLNKILKGHRRGELTVLTGPTGSGKTTFISDYSLDLAIQGVNTLWGSFEIRNSRLAKTMLQQMAGLPLDDNLHLFDEWADKFEKLPMYFMTFHGQQTIKVVMEAVEHAVYVYDIAHVIVDNLQFMMGVSEDNKYTDRFWKQDAIVAAFRQFATRKNCHVTLVIHPRKERDEDLTASSIFGGAKASQEADNIIILQDKRLVASRGKKYLQVVKNRYSGDLGVFPLDFDKASLSFQQKKPKEKKPDEGEKKR